MKFRNGKFPKYLKLFHKNFEISHLKSLINFSLTSYQSVLSNSAYKNVINNNLNVFRMEAKG